MHGPWLAIGICLVACASHKVEASLAPLIRRQDGADEYQGLVDRGNAFVAHADASLPNSSVGFDSIDRGKETAGQDLPLHSIGKDTVTEKKVQLVRRANTLQAEGHRLHRLSKHRKHAILFASGGELEPLGMPSNKTASQKIDFISPTSASIVIPSSGIIDGSINSVNVFPNDAIVMDLSSMKQMPATLPPAPATAAPTMTLAPQTPIAPVGPTTAPVAPGAPAAPAPTPAATTAAPQDSGGSWSGFFFNCFIILIGVGLMAAAAAAFLKLQRDRKKAEGGRLGALAAAEEASETSEFWRSTKKRQSYRKAALGEDGALSDSAEDVNKSESPDDGRRKSNSGAMKSTASYRERRSGNQAKNEDTSASDSHGADPRSHSKEPGELNGGTGVSYRNRRSRRPEASDDKKTAALDDEEEQSPSEKDTERKDKGASSYRSRRGTSQGRVSASPRAPRGEMGGTMSTEDV